MKSHMAETLGQGFHVFTNARNGKREVVNMAAIRSIGIGLARNEGDRQVISMWFTFRGEGSEKEYYAYDPILGYFDWPKEVFEEESGKWAAYYKDTYKKEVEIAAKLFS